jgi:hypothetical protein
MINAEFMDIFGLLGFIVLLFIGIKVLNSKDLSLKKYGVLTIIISSLGIIVDGYIVLTNFILN